MDCNNNGGSAKVGIIVPATDSAPGGYDGNGGY
jgi:hypothetical protein